MREAVTMTTEQDFERVGVVGCGLMGSGIAEVAARAGLDVVVREVDQHDARCRASAGSRTRWPGPIKAGKITDDAARGRVEAAALHHRHGRDGRPSDRGRGGRSRPRRPRRRSSPRSMPVVEDPGAILASNTSSIPIMKLAMSTRRARAGDRHPLLQPGAGAEPRRAGHVAADLAETADGRRPSPTAAGQTGSSARRTGPASS